MSEPLFSTVHVGSGGRAGYRLRRIEVFNWGTFDGRVWRVEPDGDTSLLTGDIGSGKSTLVDAITTLLLPANRIAYNKAAGAESKERSLRSYVEGHYKSERNETTGTSRAIGLRDHRSYSVILGVFANDGFDEEVTLAQVFHQKDQAGQPDRFFVTANKTLEIQSDFADFGSDLNQLRKRLRSSGVDISTTYPEYFSRFKRLLGIKSEQALKLFLQTVSMKSVGNLNEFVRSHMLEPVDAADKVRDIVGHFEDLTKAHQAVTRARDQLAALHPLVEAAAAYDAAAEKQAGLERQRQAVRFYVAELRMRLLDDEMAAHEEEKRLATDALGTLVAKATGLSAERDQLREERAGAGGDRIGELERIEQVAGSEADARRSRRDRYRELVAAAGLDPVDDAAAFADTATRVAELVGAIDEQRRILDEMHADHLVRRNDLQRRIDEAKAEIESLRGRRSNLGRQLLDVRERLCADLGLDVDDLPFAGELIDVAADHAEWRGAAERVLRGFAQSLLVDQDHYQRVSQWVNDQHLGIRLVYERVPHHRIPLRSVREPGVLVLAETLEVAEGRFEDYLHGQLARRAGHLCATSLQEFREAERAVTQQGQVRSKDRHEKDDRHRADDPRYWLLGWSNQSKIAALEGHVTDLDAERGVVAGLIAEVVADRDSVQRRERAYTGLAEYTQWRDIDVDEAEQRKADARAERERLLAGSSRLAEIEGRLTDVDRAIGDNEEQQTHVKTRISRADLLIEQATEARHLDEQRLGILDDEQLRVARATYDDIESLLGASMPKRSDACEAASDRLTDDLDRQIKKIDTAMERHRSEVVKHMNTVRNRWPEATTEMDAHIDARSEFVAFHARVATDDLPTYETEFKRQLNTETIRELAGFNNWLRRQREQIHGRVARINEALGAIDYSAGRIIRLLAEPTPNQEIKQFQSDLRAATDDTLAPDGDQYSEQRFGDVKRIIERFRGRVDHADADKAWTAKVTDIRNWFTFAASEQDKVTGEEYEHYRDSDGKSGGQKEKLAYTILAASLAYQFGLEWGVDRARDFRFVVIDEAFGRGSDESTRYALELFAKLGLQLLVVTPLQKVHVIEPYVKAIGFVDNPDGRSSRVQTLTLEEFRERRVRDHR